MLKALTWCGKCLFLYLVVVILALRFSWIFVLPVWSVATRLHWTSLSQFVFLLNYFLPIFAASGFLLGLVPFHRLGRALEALLPRTILPQPETALERTPAILWAWVPVAIAFLTRYLTWSSRNSTVLGPHQTSGRFIRFFGSFNAQNPSLLDGKWGSDRFVYTAPMLFLMACALAVLIRRSITRHSQTADPTKLPASF
ncbi:hypothetical protein [Edaphobacter bradus]|uniref:hypothetical protein n=1 Tax=Edaphobacter bradus TaxID=2259016 RepID=UPI0021DF7613|nr:hypothetical protein [Edaphobacter bradus]